VCGNFILPESANHVFFYPFFILRKILYLILSYTHVDIESRKNNVTMLNY